MFYPLEALPVQIRWLGYFSPITYVMEAARAQYRTQQVDVGGLFVGTILCVGYFIASLLFLYQMYDRSRKTGEFALLSS